MLVTFLLSLLHLSNTHWWMEILWDGYKNSYPQICMSLKATKWDRSRELKIFPFYITYERNGLRKEPNMVLLSSKVQLSFDLDAALLTWEIADVWKKFLSFFWTVPLTISLNASVLKQIRPLQKHTRTYIILLVCPQPVSKVSSLFHSCWLTDTPHITLNVLEILFGYSFLHFILLSLCGHSSGFRITLSQNLPSHVNLYFICFF